MFRQYGDEIRIQKNCRKIKENRKEEKHISLTFAEEN